MRVLAMAQEGALETWRLGRGSEQRALPNRSVAVADFLDVFGRCSLGGQISWLQLVGWFHDTLGWRRSFGLDSHEVLFTTTISNQCVYAFLSRGSMLHDYP